MYAELKSLFLRCLDADYLHTEKKGSFACEREGDVLYLLFEGSNGADDWRNNLSFSPVSHEGAEQSWMCHGGFLGVWLSILPFIEGEINDEKVKKIICCGFSHGGAISALAHEHVWYARPDLREVNAGFGFGAPRIFFGRCENGCARRWERFFVIRNDNDAVTHLPPSIFGFSHVGHIYQIGDGSTNAIEAHFPESYIKSLSSGE